MCLRVEDVRVGRDLESAATADDNGRRSIRTFLMNEGITEGSSTYLEKDVVYPNVLKKLENNLGIAILTVAAHLPIIKI